MNLKGWTKKGRAELKSEKERLDKLDKTIVGLARLSAEDSLYWNYCQRRDLFESDWWKRHIGISQKTRAMLDNRFIQLGGRVFSIAIRGCGGAESNYDLEDEVEKQYRGSVSTDSESGGLFIDVLPEIEHEVLALLYKLDPNGEFIATDVMKVREETPDEEKDLLPSLHLDLPFGNWGSTHDYLEGRDIKVTMDFSDAPGPSKAQLEHATDVMSSAVELFRPELNEPQIQAAAEELKIFLADLKLTMFKP